IDADDPTQMVAARYASPLVLGLGDDAGYVASDIPAILSHTRRVVFLRDGVMAVVTPEGSTLSRVDDGEEVPLEETQITWSPAMAEKGGYKHFMLKEIHEQPEAIANTLRGRISQERGVVDLPELAPEVLRPEAPERVLSPTRIYMVACGTSWHAGLVGRYLMENLAGLAPHVELASEFRYRSAPIDDHTLVIAISQSGETADTLAAIKDARERGATIISICNVLESSIPRISHGTLYTHAGPEISVASTKAFTTQLAALHLLALHLGQQRGLISPEVMAEELDALVRVPSTMERVLQDDSAYLGFARRWHEANSMLFLGRGNLYPLALEGALKLKEI
ncbi:MAG: SIS domain-containing protein, partial [Myxococcota bacterium]|nr:SIS domain-containing protein [Myxococcota bacterium]